jgi:FixJ family two-component response regulator
MVVHRVGVVDDDESVRESIASLMESAGYRVEGFASADQLLARPSLPEIECLILDVCMPGMDGLELQSRLAAAGRRIPIVFVTAHADQRTRERAMKAGAAAVLQKPFSCQALLDVTRAVFQLGRK